VPQGCKTPLPFDLATEELNLVSLSPQAKDIPAARKKPRIEEPFPTTTDEAAGKTASPAISVGLPPATADNDDVNADLVTDTQPNAGATTMNRHWTLEEDATLTSVFVNT
jgi:hypothetical protein